jgi:hypothetical protein
LERAVGATLFVLNHSGFLPFSCLVIPAARPPFLRRGTGSRMISIQEITHFCFRFLRLFPQR